MGMSAQARSKSLTWGKRILVIVLILGGITYGVLSFAARSKEPIRLGLQDYLTQATGHPAAITDMISVKLVPDMELRIKGITIRDKDKKDKTLVKAAQTYIALPFWHLVFGINSYIGFEVGGVEVASGFFLPKKLVLDYAGISDPTGGVKAPQFLMDGTYNAQELLITGEMIRKERGRKAPLYKFDDSFRITAKLGKMDGEAVFLRHLTDVALEDVRVRRPGYVALFTVEKIERNPAHADIKGTINDIPFTADVKPNLVTITPGSSDPIDLKTLDLFFAGVAKDIGVDEKPETLKFEIASPAETETKE